MTLGIVCSYRGAFGGALMLAFLLAIVARPARAQVGPGEEQEKYGSTHYIVAFPDTVPNVLDVRYPNTRVRPEASLWLYSIRKNTVRITGPDGYSNSVVVEANRVKALQIPSTVAAVTTIPNVPLRKSFDVTADYPVFITCYFAHIQGLEAWTPLPVERWGTSYRAASTPGEVVYDLGVAGETEIPIIPKAAPAQILIVAAEDGTHVTADPPAGVRFQGFPQRDIFLNAGEVFLLQSVVNLDSGTAIQQDIGATRIESNKPIGVVSGNARAKVFANDEGIKNNAYKNLTAEWLRPAGEYGTRFLFTPTWDGHRPGIGAAAERQREFVRLYSTGEGAVQGTLSFAGDSIGKPFTIEPNSMIEFDFQYSTAIHIATDRPVQAAKYSVAIVQFTGSTPCFRNLPCLSYTAWAPYMVELTPRERWTSFAPYYAPPNPGGMQHYINVITDTNSILKIVNEKGTTFLFNRRIPGTDLIWGSMSVSQGEDHWLMGKNGARFSGYVYGEFQGGEEYRPGRAGKKDDDRSALAAHPCEYEEYNALAYGYPLVSSPEPGPISSAEPAESAAGYAIAVTAGGDAIEIRYTLPRAETVRLTIHDLTGAQVAALVDEPVAAGEHLARLNARGLPAGAYLCRIEAGRWSRTVSVRIVR